MQTNLEAQIGSHTRAADVMVGGACWRVHIVGIRVVGHDAFVQVALVGPTRRTATVRIAARIVDGVTGRQILDAVCDWLASGDRRRHRNLDARGAGSPEHRGRESRE